MDERRTPRLQPAPARGQRRARSPARRGPLDPHDAQAARDRAALRGRTDRIIRRPYATRRSRQRHDGVVRGEHVCASYFRSRFAVMMHHLHRGVADALGLGQALLGHRHVDDAPLVGVERAEASARGPCASPSRRGTAPSGAAPSPCRCRKLEAVHDDALVVGKLVAEDGGRDVLQRLQPLGLVPQQQLAVLADEVHARAVRRVLHGRLHRQPHRRRHALHEIQHPRVEIEIVHVGSPSGLRACGLRLAAESRATPPPAAGRRPRAGFLRRLRLQLPLGRRPRRVRRAHQAGS